MTLTERFKKGTLEPDWYYCVLGGEGQPEPVFITKDEENLCYAPRVYEDITKVCGRVPSYSEYRMLVKEK